MLSMLPGGRPLFQHGELHFQIEATVKFTNINFHKFLGNNEWSAKHY